MIPCDHLPATLWAKGILRLPGDLCDVYVETLKEIGCYEQARIFIKKNRSYGGLSKDETYEHFSRMYLNSVSRIQCVMLDPIKSFGNISRDLLLTLSSHHIAILDIPCGAGAGTISALCTLKELRMSGILPMTPLTVNVLGADISPYALDLYRNQLSRIEPRLASAAINVRYETRLWDATKVQQTNELIDSYISIAPKHSEYLVLVANFSGAGKKLYEHLQDSFKQFWIRLSNRAARCSTILWIEPDINTGKVLLTRILDLVNPYNWFRRTSGENQKYLSCHYKWFMPLQNSEVPSSVLAHIYSRY